MHRSIKLFAAVIGLGWIGCDACGTSISQDFDSLNLSVETSESHASPQVRGRGARDDRRIYRNRIEPHWIAGTAKFWYRNDLAKGGKEFVIVDANAGTRTPAFDHAIIAKALGDDGSKDNLPIDSLE